MNGEDRADIFRAVGVQKRRCQPRLPVMGMNDVKSFATPNPLRDLRRHMRKDRKARAITVLRIRITVKAKQVRTNHHNDGNARLAFAAHKLRLMTEEGFDCCEAAFIF